MKNNINVSVSHTLDCGCVTHLHQGLELQSMDLDAVDNAIKNATTLIMASLATTKIAHRCQYNKG